MERASIFWGFQELPTHIPRRYGLRENAFERWNFQISVFLAKPFIDTK